MTLDLQHELFKENPIFYAGKDFQGEFSSTPAELYLDAKQDRLKFWAKEAECLDWFRKWDQVLEWNPPYAKWFQGATLNACYNCVDRHINTSLRNKAAIIWQGERQETRTLTYWDLYREVCTFANVLKSLGCQKHDTVAIYMPMIPETIVAMLACARIGAVHTVVFGGFSAEALKERIIDAQAKFVVTADGAFRRGKLIALKEAADQAVQECPSVKNMIVVRHSHAEISMRCSRDYWYDVLSQEVPRECPVEEMQAEDRLFILYTSGTTGKPKGIVHTTGGYMVGAHLTCRWVFDMQPRDVYWCTADVGWITGHTYVVYGPLSNGVTQVIYEGAPDWPSKDCYWKLIEKFGITIFYTAPTAIRTFMKWGEELPKGCDLSRLRLLGSVGEPINPECWMWYYTHIGSSKCPIVDTWWQTETGSILIAPFPGHTPLKPGSATFALPGIEAAILDDAGTEKSSGFLAITSPWPSMCRGIHNDPERFENTYWSKWGGKFYNTSDGAMKDEEGYFWLMGRVDDVMNVSGHRLGSMELESALVDHPIVAEAAVVGIPHEIKGQAIVAFVSLKDGQKADDKTEALLKQHVVSKIGPFARPERIIFTHDLPKTRSGKIIRRLLRNIADGSLLGDVTTLSDPSIVADLKSKYDED